VKRRLVLAVLIGLIATLGATLANTEELVCSAMRGRLVMPDGSAVAGVTVRRDWTWRGKSGQDVTRTDANGAFSFAEVPAKRGLLGFLPAEEAVMQRYFALLDEGPFEFLYITRRELSKNGETHGADFNVRCTVGATPGHEGFAWGTCTLMR